MGETIALTGKRNQGFGRNGSLGDFEGVQIMKMQGDGLQPNVSDSTALPKADDDVDR